MGSFKSQMLWLKELFLCSLARRLPVPLAAPASATPSCPLPLIMSGNPHWTPRSDADSFAEGNDPLLWIYLQETVQCTPPIPPPSLSGCWWACPYVDPMQIFAVLKVCDFNSCVLLESFINGPFDNSMLLSVTYCYGKITLKPRGFKRLNMCLLFHNANVLGIQERFSSVNQSQSHTIRYEYLIKILVGLLSSKDSIGVGWFPPRELPHMTVQFGLAICSLYGGLIECPHGMVTGWSLQRLMQERPLWNT